MRVSGTDAVYSPEKEGSLSDARTVWLKIMKLITNKKVNG